MLLVACDTNVSTDGPDQIPPREPVRGGRVTFGVLGEPPTLDPYSKIASDLTYFLARPVYRSIFQVRPDGTVAPDLVDLDNLRSAPGGVTVELRRARWSNGDPVTARDVVYSVRKAREPSGFTGLSATAVDKRVVRFRGSNFGDWARRLAIGTFVVPRGADLEVGSGPFVVTRYVPGLEIVYERNPAWTGEPALLNRLTVQFISSTGMMLALLERGRLDAAAPPSSINLDERLDEAGLAHAESRLRETIALDLDEVTAGLLRSTIIGAIDRDHIAEGLVRDDGRALPLRTPDKRMNDPAVEIQLGAPAGDELLQLMQRVMQKDLARVGIESELAQIDPATYYGEWESESPLDAALRREVVPGFDKPRPPSDLSWFPLFSVDTFLAWNEGVDGLEPNGGLDGPLWNSHLWSRG